MTNEENIAIITSMIAEKEDEIQYMDSATEDCYKLDLEIQALKLLRTSYQKGTK